VGRQLVAAMREGWDDTVLLVCSDHEQEKATAAEPLDLAPVVADLGAGWAVAPEGSAATVVAPGDAGVSALLRLPGVAGAEQCGRRTVGRVGRPWNLVRPLGEPARA